MSEVIQFRPRPMAAPSEDAVRHARIAMAADMLLRAESLALQASSMLVTAQTRSTAWRAATVLAETRRQALGEMTPPPLGAA